MSNMDLLEIVVGIEENDFFFFNFKNIVVNSLRFLKKFDYLKFEFFWLEILFFITKFYNFVHFIVFIDNLKVINKIFTTFKFIFC